MNRRGFIVGIGALLVAPPIVRASSIMPVKIVSATSETIGSFEPLTTNATPEWIAQHIAIIAERALSEWRRLIEDDFSRAMAMPSVDDRALCLNMSDADIIRLGR